MSSSRGARPHGATGISQWTPLADMDASQRMLRLADGPDGVHWFVVGRAELERWADRAREYDPKATLPGAAVTGSRVHRAVIPPCDRRVNGQENEVKG